MFSSPEVSVPGAVLVAAMVIGGTAYVLAPEVGTRLVANSHVVERCEKGLEDEARRARDEALSRINSHAPATIDAGKLFEGLFGGRPGSTEFFDRYGQSLKNITNALQGPAAAQAEAAQQVAERTAAAIKEKFERQAEAHEGVCACRARLAVNAGINSLALFTATGGWVRWAPLTDWSAAMAAREIISQCEKGVL